MVKLIIACMIMCFLAGVFYGKCQVHIKRDIRRMRKEALIRFKNNILDFRMRWQQDHPETKALMLSSGYSNITYKGGWNNMSEIEFQTAIRKER